MGHTNSTANLSLPQFIGTDKPTWLGDINGAFSAIDAYAGTNDAAVSAAASDASSAISQAATAVNTANTANTTAGNASTAANNAIGVANNAVAIAGTVDSKVGLLADLTTTDRTSIVNAINEVNAAIGTPTAAQVTYDNTGSGLTATNVQDAIDEVAQGGGGSSAWTLAGTETGLTAITLPATWNEILVVCSVGGNINSNVTVNIPADAFVATHVFRAGWYVSNNGNGSASFIAGSGNISLTEAYDTGTDKAATSVTKVYYR